ncbi:protein kinase domain-containing protein [Thermosynechococcus sp. FA-CM-4201]
MPLMLRGRYVAQQILGQGGFGITYLARDLDTPAKRQCVIKQLQVETSNPALLQKAEDLFKREARLLEKLGEHPQIPTLFAFFQERVSSTTGEAEQNYFYLVQEFIDGDTLESELAQQGYFSEEEVRIILKDLLPVLQYIHDQGVIHRDIKPANIIRQSAKNSRFPGQRRLYLIDFGAVKDVSRVTEVVKGHTRIYTEDYAAPEQQSGEQVFPSSDLYALAVTCVVLLTGKDPRELFDNYHHAWNWQKQVQITPIFQDILAKMLALDPRDRYQSAKEVEVALADLRVDEPPPPPLIPSVNWLLEKYNSGSYTDWRELQTYVTPVGLSPHTYEAIFIENRSNPSYWVITDVNQQSWLVPSQKGELNSYLFRQTLPQNPSEKSGQLLKPARVERQDQYWKMIEAGNVIYQPPPRPPRPDPLQLVVIAFLFITSISMFTAIAVMLLSKGSGSSNPPPPPPTPEPITSPTSTPTLTSTETPTLEPSPTNETDSPTKLSWKPACGSSRVPKARWWPVRGPSVALSTVKQRYCGDAIIVGGQTQAASFRSKEEAEIFADLLSRESGYSFYVGEPKWID